MQSKSDKLHQDAMNKLSTAGRAVLFSALYSKVKDRLSDWDIEGLQQTIDFYAEEPTFCA
jgi:hypothetical protein